MVYQKAYICHMSKIIALYFFCSLHIPPLLIHPANQVHACPEQAGNRIYVHSFMPKFVVPFNHGSLSMCRDATHTPTAIFSQTFIPQMQVCFPANFQPHGLAIILLDVCYPTSGKTYLSVLRMQKNNTQKVAKYFQNFYNAFKIEDGLGKHQL